MNYDDMPIQKDNKKMELQEFPDGFNFDNQQPIKKVELTLQQKLASKLFKTRIEGYEQLSELFQKQDQEALQNYAGSLQNYVVDSVFKCQEQALVCVQKYLDIVKSDQNIQYQELTQKIIEKCCTHPKLTTLANEIVVTLFSYNKEQFVSIIESCLQQKNIKIVIVSLQLMAECLKAYGSIQVSYKFFTQLVVKNIQNTNSQIGKEAINTFKEFYKWYGDSICVYLRECKQSIQDDINKFTKEYEKVPMKPTRCEEIIEVSKEKNSIEIDLYEESDPVDVYQLFNEQFCDRIYKIQKWSEKQEELVKLIKVLDVPRIKEKQASFIQNFVKLGLNDSNYNISMSFIKIFNLLCKGLRKAFTNQAKNLTSLVFLKLKDKKQPVCDLALTALQSSLKYCISFDEIMEDVQNCFQDKNESFKYQCLQLIDKIIDNKKFKANMKNLLKNIQHLFEDSSDKVRNLTYKITGNLINHYGIKFIGDLMDHLNQYKKDKIKQHIKIENKPSECSPEKANSNKSEANKNVQQVSQEQQYLQQKGFNSTIFSNDSQVRLKGYIDMNRQLKANNQLEVVEIYFRIIKTQTNDYKTLSLHIQKEFQNLMRILIETNQLNKNIVQNIIYFIANTIHINQDICLMIISDLNMQNYQSELTQNLLDLCDLKILKERQINEIINVFNMQLKSYNDIDRLPVQNMMLYAKFLLDNASQFNNCRQNINNFVKTLNIQYEQQFLRVLGGTQLPKCIVSKRQSVGNVQNKSSIQFESMNNSIMPTNATNVTNNSTITRILPMENYKINTDKLQDKDFTQTKNNLQQNLSPVLFEYLYSINYRFQIQGVQSLIENIGQYNGSILQSLLEFSYFQISNQYNPQLLQVFIQLVFLLCQKVQNSTYSISIINGIVRELINITNFENNSVNIFDCLQTIFSIKSEAVFLDTLIKQLKTKEKKQEIIQIITQFYIEILNEDQLIQIQQQKQPLPESLTKKIQNSLQKQQNNQIQQIQNIQNELKMEEESFTENMLNNLQNNINRNNFNEVFNQIQQNPIMTSVELDRFFEILNKNLSQTVEINSNWEVYYQIFNIINRLFELNPQTLPMISFNEMKSLGQNLINHLLTTKQLSEALNSYKLINKLIINYLIHQNIITNSTLIILDELLSIQDNQILYKEKLLIKCIEKCLNIWDKNVSFKKVFQLFEEKVNKNSKEEINNVVYKVFVKIGILEGDGLLEELLVSSKNSIIQSVIKKVMSKENQENVNPTLRQISDINKPFQNINLEQIGPQLHHQLQNIKNNNQQFDQYFDEKNAQIAEQIYSNFQRSKLE